MTNVVGLDDYLQGVVPAESPASWPAEALRAQAIAARTYAITTAKSADFDHYADTRSQVYKGVGIEQPSTNAAVADTRGQIVTYQGQPVVTYFFSTSRRQDRVGREHVAGPRAASRGWCPSRTSSTTSRRATAGRRS